MFLLYLVKKRLNIYVFSMLPCCAHSSSANRDGHGRSFAAIRFGKVKCDTTPHCDGALRPDLIYGGARQCKMGQDGPFCFEGIRRGNYGRLGMSNSPSGGLAWTN